MDNKFYGHSLYEKGGITKWRKGGLSGVKSSSQYGLLASRPAGKELRGHHSILTSEMLSKPKKQQFFLEPSEK